MRAGGQVISSEFSEAATLVMLRDGGGTLWRCLAYSDGTVGELSVEQAADDGGGAMAGADIVAVTGVSANDVLNIRSGPSTGHDIIGALANGDRVRNLGCQARGNSQWCRIGLLDDMGGEGWVNARYLALGATTPRPAAAAAPQRVRFAPGTSGAVIAGSLLPQQAHRYVLGASDGQFLRVRVGANGPGMVYRILNPDGSELLGEMTSDREYRGQLWRSGDHVVEVINRANGAQTFDVTFAIE